MKKIVFSALIVIALLGCSHLAVGFSDTSLKEDHAVTVSDYCTFLNAIAASDPHHLYEEKMAIGLASDCIRRTGALSSYHYEVIDGQENVPVVWVSYLSALRYCHWREESKCADNVEITDDENLVVIPTYHSGSIADLCDIALLQSSHPSIIKKRKEQTEVLRAASQGQLDGGLLLLALMIGGSSMREGTSSVADEENIRRSLDLTQNIARRSAPIPQRDGLTGLSNFTGQCGLNSAMQVFSKASKIVLEQGTIEKKERLRATIEAQMPCFGRFSRQEFRTEDDCRALHQEVGRQLPSVFVAGHFGDLNSIAQRYFLSIDHRISSVSSVTILQHLLERHQVAPIYFEQSQGIFGTGISSHSEAMLTLENHQKSPFSTLQDCLDSRLRQQGSRLVAPFPPVLVIALRSFSIATKVVEDITLPHKDGTYVAYQPKAISCHISPERSESGHAFVLIKEKESWYELNDDRIFRIPKAWEDEMKNYCSEHAAVMLYEKKNVDTEVSSEHQGPSDTLLETAKSLEQACRLPAGFLASAEQAKEFLPKLENRSFFCAKASQILSEHKDAIINTAINSATTLMEEALERLDVASENEGIRPLLEEAFQKTKHAKEIWEQTAAACRTGLNQVPEDLQEYWRRALEKAEECKQECSSILAYLEARRDAYLVKEASSSFRNSYN